MLRQCIVTLALVVCSLFFQAVSLSQGITSSEKELLQFACDFSSPCFGVNAFFHPYEAPYLVLKHNSKNEGFPSLLGLSISQIEAGKDLESLLTLEKEGRILVANEEQITSLDDHDKIYSFLDEKQKWSMELVRLQTEGFSALRRPAIAEWVELDDKAKEDVAELIAKYRKDYVAPHFRRTFARSGSGRYDEWYLIKINCRLNLEILSVLNEKQQARLLTLAHESEKFEEISFRAFQVYLGQPDGKSQERN